MISSLIFRSLFLNFCIFKIFIDLLFYWFLTKFHSGQRKFFMWFQCCCCFTFIAVYFIIQQHMVLSCEFLYHMPLKWAYGIIHFWGGLSCSISCWEGVVKFFNEFCQLYIWFLNLCYLWYSYSWLLWLYVELTLLSLQTALLYLR